MVEPSLVPKEKIAALREVSRRLFADISNPYILFLLSFPFFCAFYSALGFLIGITISQWHLVLSLASAATVAFIGANRGLKATVWSVALGLLTIAGCVFLSALFLDYSGDAITFHHPAEIALAKGWNPIRTPKPWDWDPAWTPPRAGNRNIIQLAYFPKAQWCIGAVIYHVFNKIEVANFSRLLYILASFLVLLKTLPAALRLPRGLSRFVAAVVALNPYALTQWQTGFSDGMLASLFAVVLVSTAAFIRSGNIRFVPYVLLTLPILVNVKFTGLVYGAIAMLGLLLLAYFVRRDRCKRVLQIGVLSGAVALLMGINPYITNIHEYGSPLHPVLSWSGKNKGSVRVGTAGDVAPLGFNEKNRFEQFFIGNILADPLRQTKHRAVSYNKNRHNFNLMTYETRLGGLGSLFRLPLLLGLLLILFCIGRRYTLGLVLIILATVFIHHATWYSRYIPQVWMLPPVVVAALLASGRPRRWLRWLGQFVLFAMLCNALAIFETTFTGQVENTRSKYETLLRFMDSNPGYDEGLYYSDESTYLTNKWRIEDMLGVPLKRFEGTKKGLANLFFFTYYRLNTGNGPEGNKALTFKSFYEQYATQGVGFLTVREDAVRKMGAEIKTVIQGAGGRVGRLKYRDSYAAVMVDGFIVQEKRSSNRRVTIKHRTDWGEANVYSTGRKAGRSGSAVMIDGENYSRNRRGVNFVVVRGDEILVTSYDTTAHVNPKSSVTVIRKRGILDYVGLALGFKRLKN